MAGTDAGDPKRDLDTRGQIHDLVIRFYREVVFDDLLAPVSPDAFACVEWRAHPSDRQELPAR